MGGGDGGGHRGGVYIARGLIASGLSWLGDDKDLAIHESMEQLGCGFGVVSAKYRCGITAAEPEFGGALEALELKTNGDQPLDGR